MYFSNKSLLNVHSNLTNERNIYYIVNPINFTTTPPTPETAHFFSLPCWTYMYITEPAIFTNLSSVRMVNHYTILLMDLKS